MKNSNAILINHAENYLHQMAQGADDPLSAVLSTDDLLMFQQLCTRVRNYPAVQTLFLFLRQAISADKSCPNALIADVADQTALQNKRLKTRNDAYCKARKRLVESEVKSLFQFSGQRLDEAGPEAQLWHDRRVVLTDGSTLSMPDSQDNQAVYPQPSTQKKNSVFRS